MEFTNKCKDDGFISKAEYKQESDASANDSTAHKVIGAFTPERYKVVICLFCDNCKNRGQKDNEHPRCYFDKAELFSGSQEIYKRVAFKLYRLPLDVEDALSYSEISKEDRKRKRSGTENTAEKSL